MKIVRSSGYLSIEFNNPKVKKLQYDDEGTVSVLNQDNKAISHFKTVAQVVFNSQYGTPISEDGQYVFIGNWERGLFCYSLTDGQLKWKQEPGMVRTVIPYKDLLIIEMANRGVYIRSADTRELVKVIKMSGLEVFIRISDKELFVGPKFNRYFIYSLDTLQPLYEISKKYLNINRCYSFVIKEVFYKNDELYIKGSELGKDMIYNPSEEHTPFERKVSTAK